MLKCFMIMYESLPLVQSCQSFGIICPQKAQAPVPCTPYGAIAPHRKIAFHWKLKYHYHQDQCT
jgi:hypothetical protein